MDKIADLAGINKRMIYVYWGDKQALYDEILRQKVQAMHEVFTTDWGSPSDNLVRYFKGTLAERELLRFIQWEALGDLGPSLVAEEARRETFRLKVEAMRHDQSEGRLTSAIPPEFLMLIFMALSSFPVAFTQNVRLVTGRSSDDPEFQERWARALETLGGMLSEGCIHDGGASPSVTSATARGRTPSDRQVKRSPVNGAAADHF